MVPETAHPEDLAGDTIPEIPVPEDTFEPTIPEQEPDPEVVPEWASPEDLAGDSIPEIPVPEDTFEPTEPEQEPTEVPEQEQDPEVVPEWANPEDLAGDVIPGIPLPEDTFEPTMPEQEPDPEVVPEWANPEDLAGETIPEIPVPEDTFEPAKPEQEPTEIPEQEQDPEVVPEWANPEDLAGEIIPEIPVPEDTFEPTEPKNEPVEKAEQESEQETSTDNVQENSSASYTDTIQEGNRTLIITDNFSSSYDDIKSSEGFTASVKRNDQRKTEKQLPRKSKKSQDQKKDSRSDNESSNRQRSAQSTVLVLKPELQNQEKEKEAKKETKKEQLKKENEEKEIKTTENGAQKDVAKDERDIEQEIPDELKEKYRQESGKRPIYNGKKTKGFDEWLKEKAKIEQEKQKDQETEEKEKLAEDWEKTLETWINEADEKEISKEIKKELTEKIRKYRKFREIARRLSQLLGKELLSEKEIGEIEELIKAWNDLQDDLFEDLLAFRDFYIKNIDWFKYRIKAEQEKFIKYLAQKLKNLKKIKTSITDKINKEQAIRNWKEILKNNLYKNTILTIDEKSLIIKIIKKHKLDEDDKKQLISILSKLPTEDLISLLGNDFENHTRNYVKWGWDYDQAVKRLILNTYIHNYNRVFETAKEEDNILKFSKDKFYNNPEFKDWLLIYNPSIVSREIKRQVITTRKFIEALRELIQKIVPKKYLRKKNGVFTLSDNKLSKFLGKEERYIKTYINKYIRENPTFKIALDILMEWKSALKRNFGILAKKAINLIDAYIILHKPVIPISRKKQMQIYRFHRFFNVNYFSVIDTIEKAYWLGFFFADGYITIINKQRTKIGIQVAKKDIEILLRWCGALGLNPNFIRPKKDKLLYKGEIREYEGIVIEFSSPKMAKDLIALGYKGSSSKSTKWPKIDFKNRQLDLAFLLGFYDGEGFEGRTALCSHSRRIIEDIKKKFKIPHKIQPRKDGGFVLSLGAKLFNEMMKNYKNSLQRKRFKANIKKFGVKSRFESIMTKELLQELMDQMPISHIAKNYEVQDRDVLTLIKKWNLKKKPKGYWNRKENRSNL